MKHLISLAIVAAMCASAVPAPARATVMGIAAGDLVKMKGDSAVYYLDRDWRRHPFPTLDVYNSWYKDFSTVKELPLEDISQLRLGTPIVYRPGARLVKIVSDPKVYAVEPGGMLRPIASEAVAKNLYGDAWAKRVVDVPDSYFFGYKIGTALVLPVHSTGTLVRRSADGSLFIVEGSGKRHVAPAAASALGYRDPYIVNMSGTLDEYTDLIPLTDASDRKYRDTAQESLVSTLPPPQVEFPAVTPLVEAPGDVTLAAVRVTSGVPTTIRRVTVTLKGMLRHEGVPLVENIRIVDEAGTDLFGIHQLADNAGIEHKVVFDGAYALPENASKTMYLKAKLHASLKKGEIISAVFDRAGFRISDDSAGGMPTEGYFPRTAFPTVSVVVK